MYFNIFGVNDLFPCENESSSHDLPNTHFFNTTIMILEKKRGEALI